jgi:hypothetical protein
MQRALSLVLSAWAGSLWTVCGVVAPSLFNVLPDRHLAGQVAGYFFALESWLGLALGSIAWLLMKRIAKATHTDYALLLATIIAPLISEVGLRPMMDTARAASDMSRFGVLHGVSALLFAIACVTSLWLWWRANSPRNN